MGQSLVPLEEIGKKRTAGHGGGVQQKYVLDERGRHLLLELYDGTSERITELERLLRVPRWKVRRWASDLNLVRRQRHREWTHEELAYLEKHLHHHSLSHIAKHLDRTTVAIRVKAKRLGVNKCGQEGYTMRGVCEALGCDHHKVERWIKAGWIEGTRRKTERSQADVWLFTDEQIRKLLLLHPLEVDPRRFDWLFVHSLLTGVRELSSPLQGKRDPRC